MLEKVLGAVKSKSVVVGVFFLLLLLFNFYFLFFAFFLPITVLIQVTFLTSKSIVNFLIINNVILSGLTLKDQLKRLTNISENSNYCEKEIAENSI